MRKILFASMLMAIATSSLALANVQDDFIAAQSASIDQETMKVIEIAVENQGIPFSGFGTPMKRPGSCMGNFGGLCGDDTYFIESASYACAIDMKIDTTMLVRAVCHLH